MYSPTLSLTSAVDEVVCSTPSSNRFTPGEDGFGGLVVSMLASGTRVRGFKPGRRR